MNFGQIYETILGWAGKKLDKKYYTPVFDGASMDQINLESDEATFQDLVKLICMMVVQEIDLINQQQLV